MAEKRAYNATRADRKLEARAAKRSFDGLSRAHPHSLAHTQCGDREFCAGRLDERQQSWLAIGRFHRPDRLSASSATGFAPTQGVPMAHPEGLGTWHRF